MKKYPQIFTVEGVHKIRSTVATKINGNYVPARPLGFQSVFERFKCAWLVFTGRADALIWPEGQ